MTSRYIELYKAISELEANHREPGFIPAPPDFPFKQIYPGQLEIIDKVKLGESFCLTSHTGFGKSPVFLSLIRNESAIVIEPRKFLQTQIAKYYGDFVLFGRSGYTCPLAPYYNGAGTAANAPCLLKESCSVDNYKTECKLGEKRNKEFIDAVRKGNKKATNMCDNDPCKVFKFNSEYRVHPCEHIPCDYNSAVKKARTELYSWKVVVCNFGNFWNLVKTAKTVVVDEADLFFREISAPMKLKYSNPKKNSDSDIKTLLSLEVSGLQKAAKELSPQSRYKAQNLLFSAQFLKTNADLCFKYQRKDSYYIEIDPRNVNILSQKLFKGKRVIIVSATPGQFDLPSYSASIHQRCGIFFAPVGNLTSRSLKQNPYLMNAAAKAITEISDHFDMVYNNEHVIIHAGNLSTHAPSICKLLGEENCTLHTAGKLAETIEKYIKSGKRYLIVAAAEYGLDASWASLQFILKFPFPNLDERMRTLERAMGPDFKAYYEGEARTRVIQTAGRNVRGFDDFGVTICLDSKVKEDYEKHWMMYPAWFRERVDTRCY